MFCLQDYEIENKQLRETLEEYNTEFAEVKNQGTYTVSHIDCIIDCILYYLSNKAIYNNNNYHIDTRIYSVLQLPNDIYTCNQISSGHSLHMASSAEGMQHSDMTVKY